MILPSLFYSIQPVDANKVEKQIHRRKTGTNLY